MSYISQAYVVLLGILILPFYITWLGAEAYGLIGFFAMLQAIFGLLDLGLTPTISRETARYRAGVLSELIYIQLFRTMNLIFSSIAVLGGGALYYLSESIASNWLSIENLDPSEVVIAIKIMAVCTALRWMTGLYRGVVIGGELLVWLGGFNIIIATMRFLLVFPVMWFFGANVTVFFAYQLLVAIIEFVVLLLKALSQTPRLPNKLSESLSWSLKPLAPIISFSMSIALTSGLWVIVTQTDKLIMSKLLTLEHYGYFTLAVLVANGIMMIAGPISGAIMPRMARLEAEGKRDELLKIYSSATRLVCLLAGCSGIILIAFAEKILFVWTADLHIATTASSTLKLYAAGYLMLVIAAFPYYLQYALGNLKLHVLGSLLFVSCLLPLLYFFTKSFGMTGAGIAWVITNAVYFLLWTGIVHNKYLEKFHFSWLAFDVFKVLAVPAALALLFTFSANSESRTTMFIELSLVSITIFFLTALSLNEFRRKLKAIVGINE